VVQGSAGLEEFRFTWIVGAATLVFRPAASIPCDRAPAV